MARKRNDLLGAHMSIAGGFSQALELGASIGCNAIQLFTKNASSWQAKPLDPAEVQAFRQGLKQRGIFAVAHDSYLINLCAQDEAKRRQSVDAFAHEIERCAALGLPGLITHPGSPKEQGEQWGIAAMADSLIEVLERTAGAPVGVWLETTAGQGSSLGWRFEQLAQIIERSGKAERLGVCMDTAHIFAAGYELRTKPAWDALLAEFEASVGLARLRALHLNDSKKDLGSRVDRHERVGQGLIGLEPLRRIVHDKRLGRIPKLLEVPGGMEAFAEDLRLLRGQGG